MYDPFIWRDTISRIFNSSLLPSIEGRAADHLMTVFLLAFEVGGYFILKLTA